MPELARVKSEFSAAKGDLADAHAQIASLRNELTNVAQSYNGETLQLRLRHTHTHTHTQVLIDSHRRVLSRVRGFSFTRLA
jgi:hypothetical protein